MAAKPSTAAEKALQKIQDQVKCGICLEPYKKPKLLKCFHVFCEKCLQPLARGRKKKQNLLCPNCRKETPLPVGGVTGLQGAFYLDTLLEIEDVLKQPSLSNHCPSHPEKEADLYCEQCDQLMCSYCLVFDHRDHHYDLLVNSFAKQDKMIVQSLKPVGEHIATLERTIESVGNECAAVIEQQMAVVAEIHTSMAHMRQALEVREAELVGQAEEMAQVKLHMLEAQQDGFELQLGQLRSCHDFVEESRHTCSQGENIRMKKGLVKQVNNLTGSLKPEALTLVDYADMKFAHNLPELVKTCQQFGKVYTSQPYPQKCRASGEGIRVAMKGQTVAITLETLEKEGEACIRPVDSLKCELVAIDGSSRVGGTVKRRNQNIYDISYEPAVTGEHQLHVRIEEQPIFNSPFTVSVLPNFTAPANIIGDLKAPWGIAVREGGEVVVAERDHHCVSIISGNGRKKSFGTQGSGSGQFNNPEGVAIDSGRNILVADFNNHRIQQWSSTGKHLKTVGVLGSGPLQFKHPIGIVVNPQTQQVFVAEWSNHRIQILNSDLSYSGTFGQKGSKNEELSYPYGISTDKEGNVYVADYGNHRIQVFTVDGVYLRQFGKKGAREGELKGPVSIAIDTQNLVYVGEVGNDRVSIFTTDGEFIKSFGVPGEGPVEFKGPYGLGFHTNGDIYICDTNNHRVQCFT